MIIVGHCKAGRRVGMADEADSKSVVGNHVRVQVPLPAVGKIAEKPVNSRVRAIFLFSVLSEKRKERRGI